MFNVPNTFGCLLLNISHKNANDSTGYAKMLDCMRFAKLLLPFGRLTLAWTWINNALGHHDMNDEDKKRQIWEQMQTQKKNKFDDNWTTPLLPALLLPALASNNDIAIDGPKKKDYIENA